MAKEWIDPSEAARMLHNMNVSYFRATFVNPETRTNHHLVVQRFFGPKGTPRYKVLTLSEFNTCRLIRY